MTTETPDYLAARREWMERYGSYISSARNWRFAAIAAIGVAAIGVVGAVYEGSQTHIKPYVVEVDHLGQTVRLAKAVRAGALQKPIIRHVLTNWVVDARERITDPRAQRQMVQKTYRYVSRKGQAALSNYYKHHTPFSGHKNGSRTVTITSAIPMGKLKSTGGTYQIDWTEKQYNLNGHLESTQNWKGIVSYRVLPDRSAKQAETNPFGIYITSFQWSKTL